MPSEGIAASDDEGSRHAAPRRPLLRRLHMPVGKAIALAAMPSAALMGMGFSSPLAARADQQPENPFQDAPCVEMPDEALTEEAGEGEDSEATEETEEPAEEPEEPEEPAGEETEEPEPPVEESAEEPEPESEPTEDAAADQQVPAEEPSAEGESAEEETQAEAEEEQPAEEEETNPWDPLGLGDSLEELGESIDDFFNPGRDEQPEEPVTPEDPEESEEPEEPTQPEEPDAPEETAEPENVAPPAEADETEAPEAEDETREETEPAEEEEDAESEDEESEEAVELETVDPFAPDAQGRLPFPCPEELRVPGTDEQTPLVLPAQPWYLDASYLTLRGLDYHGVVNVMTADGTVKQVLKFTAELIDIGDLHQIVDAPGGVRYHVGTDPGSNSTFRDGTVTMYTERLEGNLFGIIPVVFDPEHQPPLDLPIAYFTDVFITQAGQFGGTLTMRGMRSYTTNDGPTTVG